MEATQETARMQATYGRIRKADLILEGERLRAVLRDVPVLFINRDAAKKNANVAALEYSEKLALWAPRAKALLSGAYEQETPGK